MADHDSPVPSTIGRYQIKALLGQGGMGEVFKAFDPSLDRIVALKTIKPVGGDEGQILLDRLYREARACGRLHHPNIVTVHDLGDVNGVVFIAMEYLEGENLGTAIETGRLSFEQKLRVLIQMLDALQYAHKEGVIHRDIKPSNVHLMPDGNVKLLDFGLARVAMADSLTRSGTIMGTPFYMSPEQLKGQVVDGRTDIYSTGVVAYELLTGRRAFDAETVTAVMLKVLSDAPPPMETAWSNTFPEIERIVTRALGKTPEERYATAEDMRNALSAFVASSHAAIARAQAEVTIHTDRAVIEAKTLLDSGRAAESHALLQRTLKSNPDAREAKTLLAKATAVMPNVAGAPTVVAPPVLGTPTVMTPPPQPTIVNPPVANPAKAGSHEGQKAAPQQKTQIAPPLPAPPAHAPARAAAPPPAPVPMPLKQPGGPSSRWPLAAGGLMAALVVLIGLTWAMGLLSAPPRAGSPGDDRREPLIDTPSGGGSIVGTPSGGGSINGTSSGGGGPTPGTPSGGGDLTTGGTPLGSPGSNSGTTTGPGPAGPRGGVEQLGGRAGGTSQTGVQPGQPIVPDTVFLDPNMDAALRAELATALGARGLTVRSSAAGARVRVGGSVRIDVRSGISGSATQFRTGDFSATFEIQSGATGERQPRQLSGNAGEIGDAAARAAALKKAAEQMADEIAKVARD